ncbi:porin family protein [Spongiimicrobium sp. 3-5]|uniref:porin family protein n=1 Tax=Spongiimicrobium sp. 3-5 TaxID=3332596 RepID=UPI00398042A4
MRGLLLLFLFGVCLQLHAQENDGTTLADSSYLEDQFYIGITYNLLLDRPTGVSQNNLSYGLQAGFIKDIPINKARTIALGIGLGYNNNSYYTNLFASESADGFEYTILDSDTSFKRNKIEVHSLEVPLEFRWRNSTATSYKFWRIYTGFRLGYTVGARSKFVSNEQVISFTNTDVRDFQYGLTLNFGYNTFNFHAYYALNNLFNDNINITNGNAVSLTPLRIGIIFYIL